MKKRCVQVGFRLTGWTASRVGSSLSLKYHENFLCWLNGCGDKINIWTSFSGVRLFNSCCSNSLGKTNTFLSHSNQIHIRKDIRCSTDHSKDIFQFGWYGLYYIQKCRWYLSSSRRCNQSALVLLRQYSSQIRLVNPPDKLHRISVCSRQLFSRRYLK